jgi:capsular polysaccharide biosynthesis protein
MELQEYVSLFKKNLRLVILLPIVFGAVAFLVSLQLEPTYTASLTIYVKRQASEPTGDFYTFDGYYSQQAAEKFTETVVGFLESKDILLASAKLAGLPTDQESLGRLEGSIKVRQEAPQLVSLKVTQKDGAGAKKFAVALAQAATERINLLNQTGDKAISVDLLNSEPLVSKNAVPVVVNTLAGVLAGALAAYLYVLLKEYFADAG